MAESLLRELPLPVAGTITLGRVSLWSRVIQNVDGWRAQFAYPYDVELVGGDPATARGLRRRYAVDVSLGWIAGERERRSSPSRREAQVMAVSLASSLEAFSTSLRASFS